jgi:hypothetical protein
MPRIPDTLLDCVIYLYETEMDAQSGSRAGGTGFLVSIPAETEGAPAALYAVTNSHVIREGNSPVVRLNTQDGRTEVISLTTDQWHHHPDGDDIAVCPIGLQPEHHRFLALDRSRWFLEEGDIGDLDVGPGDEIFFVGRFINHQGEQKNLPVVRWGNIAMLPYEPIRHPRGTLVESFLIEARSLSGFSGSPVFLYIGESLRHMGWDESSGVHPAISSAHPELNKFRVAISLLGIDWGHSRYFGAVYEKNMQTKIPEGWQAEQNSGIMNVAPTWRLNGLLQEPELMQMRREREKKWVSEYGQSDAVMDGA